MIKKRLKKITKKAPENVPEKPADKRVTNDTVSKHRDAILERGRQFKYPFHRSKHKIVFISISIALIALVLLSGVTGYQLYRRQSTNDFTYRVTQVLPFPVAEIDGQRVSYESYLFELGISLHWYEHHGTTDLRSPDGKRQIDYLKRQAMDKAIGDALVRKIAKENKVTVDEKDIDEAVGKVKSLGGDLKSILADQYGFGEKEFRRLKRDALLREKVELSLDKDSPERAKKALAEINNGKKFADAAKEFSDHLETKGQGGDFGVIEKGRANLPSNVEQALFSLEKGQVSEVVKGSSGYYILRATDKLSENRVRASIIYFQVKDIDSYLKEYRKQGKVEEYITLKEKPQQ